MSIADELREYVSHYSVSGSTKDKLLTAIADRIDEEHERVCIGAEPMTDERMAEHGWVRLPRDADGVPIRVGDVMEFTYDPPQDQPLFEVSGIGADGTLFYASRGEVFPRKSTKASVVRHYHAPTVEDVMREFAERADQISNNKNGIGQFDALVADYAAKVREVVGA